MEYTRKTETTESFVFTVEEVEHALRVYVGAVIKNLGKDSKSLLTARVQFKADSYGDFQGAVVFFEDTSSSDCSAQVALEEED